VTSENALQTRKANHIRVRWWMFLPQIVKVVLYFAHIPLLQVILVVPDLKNESPEQMSQL